MAQRPRTLTNVIAKHIRTLLMLGYAVVDTVIATDWTQLGGLNSVKSKSVSDRATVCDT